MDKTVNNLVEALGYGLILAFLYVVWPPAVLLGGGMLLVIWANTRAAKRSGTVGRTALAIGAAWGAARRAYRQHEAAVEGPPVRRIA